MKKTMRASIYFKICVFFQVLFLTAGLASAQTAEKAQVQTPPALSEPARQLLQRGIVAADAKEWTVATQYFFQAQKLEPLHPKVLFNLGFSNLHEGRDVPADLWLRAYLAVNPQAANAAQVQKEIQRLDVTIDATSGKLISEAITQLGDLADPMSNAEKEAFQMPADPSAMQGQRVPPDMAERKRNTLGAILFAQTATGRITEALNFAARMNLANVSEDSLRRYFGQIQVDAGDFEGAALTLKDIQSSSERDMLLYSMIIGEIAAERPDLAEIQIALVSGAQEKTNLLNILMLKYVRQLEVEKAERIFLSQYLLQDERLTLLVRLIAGYLKKDMPEKAKALAQELLNASDPADLKQIDRVAVALAALGRGAEAVQLVQKALAQPKRDETQIIGTYNFLIPCLCWSGQTDAVPPLLSILESFKSQAAQDQLKSLRPILYTETGEFEKVLNGLRENAPEVRDHLIVSHFWRLVQKKLYGPAAKMALVSDSDLVKSRLFLKLANAVTGPEAGFQKRELREKAFGWALTAQDVVGLKQLAQDASRDADVEMAAWAGRAAKAVTWIELADYFTRVPATSNLKNHTETFKLKGFDMIPYETALAALEWGRVSVYIRARERNQ